MAVVGDSVICPVNCFCKHIQSEREHDVFAALDSDTFTVSTRAETAGKTKWLARWAHYQCTWIWCSCLLIICSQLPLFCRNRDISVYIITTCWTTEQSVLFSYSGKRFIASPDLLRNPTSLPSNGYSKHFPLLKEAGGHEAVPFALLRSRTTEPIPAFPHISSWHGA
jgi:hypothetical protein